MKKTILISVLSLVLLAGIGGLAVAKVYAEDESRTFPPMIKGLIERFNLNEDEVAQYLDEQHEQLQVERREMMEEKLNVAVEEGKITEEQKTAILQKMDEFGGQNPEDRGNLHDWAEENGIDISELGLGHFGPGAGKPGFGGRPPHFDEEQDQ